MTTIICDSDRTFYTAIEAMAMLSMRLEHEESQTLAPFVEKFVLACGYYWLHTGDSKVEMQLCGLEERIRQSTDHALKEVRQAVGEALATFSDIDRLEMLTNMWEILDGMETALLVTGLILRPIEVR